MCVVFIGIALGIVSMVMRRCRPIFCNVAQTVFCKRHVPKDAAKELVCRLRAFKNPTWLATPLWGPFVAQPPPLTFTLYNLSRALNAISTLAHETNAMITHGGNQTIFVVTNECITTSTKAAQRRFWVGLSLCATLPRMVSTSSGTICGPHASNCVTRTYCHHRLVSSSRCAGF